MKLHRMLNIGDRATERNREKQREIERNREKQRISERGK